MPKSVSVSTNRFFSWDYEIPTISKTEMDHHPPPGGGVSEHLFSK